MYTILFNLAWPYLQKYLANKAATYLQERRTRRHETIAESAASSREAVEEVVAAAEKSGLSASTVWFTLSGVLLGSAFGLILYVLMQDSHTRP